MSDLTKCNKRRDYYPTRRDYYPSVFNPFNDDFFNDFFTGTDLPATNVKETKKAFKIEISAPGFEKENVSIEVEKNILRITAEMDSNVEEEKDEDEKVWRREFTSAAFERSFVLPENIDTENITAKAKSGVLKITLPKKENAPEKVVKQIEIK